MKFFEVYTAVNLHFTTDRYDFFKYDGKTRVNETSFLKRKDKWFFEKMAAKCNNDEMAIGFCVSNIVAGKKYIRAYDMKVYHDWIAYRDSMSYKFKEELNKYLDRKKTATEPLILLLEMLYSKEVSYEFVILFNQTMRGELYSELDKTDNFLWLELKKELMQYQPFILKLWNIHPGVVTGLTATALRG
jgi:hypothetical protein